MKIQVLRFSCPHRHCDLICIGIVGVDWLDSTQKTCRAGVPVRACTLIKLMTSKASSWSTLAKRVSGFKSNWVGLVLDRKKFIEIVRHELKKFRPFGKFVNEFKR